MPTNEWNCVLGTGGLNCGSKRGPVCIECVTATTLTETRITIVSCVLTETHRRCSESWAGPHERAREEERRRGGEQRGGEEEKGGWTG